METILRTNIKGSVPFDAEFAKLNPSKKFIEKFYKISENGGLVYYGEQGGWHGSLSYKLSDVETSPFFLRIIQTQK